MEGHKKVFLPRESVILLGADRGSPKPRLVPYVSSSDESKRVAGSPSDASYTSAGTIGGSAKGDAVGYVAAAHVA